MLTKPNLTKLTKVKLIMVKLLKGYINDGQTNK